MQSHIELSDVSVDKIEEDYKKRIFLETLKNGKLPQRRNLFKTIMFLSDCKLFRYSYILNSDLPKYTSKCTVEIAVTKQITAKEVVKDPKFIIRLKRYIGNNFKLTLPWAFNSNKFTIYYNKSDIKWGLVDHDLLTEHPLNSERRSNGFVYIKNFYRR